MCSGSTWILEKAGVLELLTKPLVQLYEEPEKSNDALTYLKQTVGGSEDDKTVIEKHKLIKDSDDKEYTDEITMNSDTEVSKTKTIFLLMTPLNLQRIMREFFNLTKMILMKKV